MASRIRIATENDVDTLFRLGQEADILHLKGKDYLIRQVNKPTRRTFVYTIDSGIAGTGSIWLDTMISMRERKGDYFVMRRFRGCEIGGLAVFREFRGKGIATELVKYRLDYIRKNHPEIKEVYSLLTGRREKFPWMKEEIEKKLGMEIGGDTYNDLIRVVREFGRKILPEKAPVKLFEDDFGKPRKETEPAAKILESFGFEKVGATSLAMGPVYRLELTR